MSTRAKDSDRADACKILDQALGDGQLSMTEHQERISAATKAVTLGDLHGLVADLQTDSAPVQLPAVRPRWRFGPLNPRLIVKVAVSLLAVGVGWSALAVIRHATSPLRDLPGQILGAVAPDGVDPVVLTPPRQLHTLGGLTGLLEQMRARFGDTIGYRLVIYPDYASLERPDPAEPRRELDYSYRGGWGQPTSTPHGGGAAAADLSRFDPKATVGILRGAPETLGIVPADIKSIYLIVEPADDPTAAGAVVLTVYVSSDYGSGYIKFAGDGTVQQVNYP